MAWTFDIADAYEHTIRITAWLVDGKIFDRLRGELERRGARNHLYRRLDVLADEEPELCERMDVANGLVFDRNPYHGVLAYNGELKAEFLFQHSTGDTDEQTDAVICDDFCVNATEHGGVVVYGGTRPRGIGLRGRAVDFDHASRNGDVIVVRFDHLKDARFSADVGDRINSADITDAILHQIRPSGDIGSVLKNSEIDLHHAFNEHLVSLEIGGRYVELEAYADAISRETAVFRRVNNKWLMDRGSSNLTISGGGNVGHHL